MTGVHDDGAELLHEVQHQARMGVFGGMEKAQEGIQPNGVNGRLDTVDQQGVAKAEERVDRVRRGPTAPGDKAQGLRLVRYADDFLVLCKDREKATQAAQLTEKVLRTMALELDEADIVHFD